VVRKPAGESVSRLPQSEIQQRAYQSFIYAITLARRSETPSARTSARGFLA
jgi:hypothetical protein